ncbi:flavoprotein, partial [Ramaria rubella]
WADMILIAPCSANTLSNCKLASSTCNNLVTSVLRAMAPTILVYVFPAMNTQMYLHHLTAVHLSVLSDTLEYTIMGPIGKGLACGDTGISTMTEWLDIVQITIP